MKNKKHLSPAKEIVPEIKEYMLRLYVTGSSPNSERAISNLSHIFEKYIRGRYNLEIIDVYQEFELAKEAQVIAVPLLIKNSPLPVRRLIGDMSETSKVLKGMGIMESNE